MKSAMLFGDSLNREARYSCGLVGVNPQSVVQALANRSAAVTGFLRFKGVK